MIPLQSSLEKREDEFGIIKGYLNQHEFSLGGNWDYDHGYFDRFLDEGHKVWLRIPFEVTRGSMDDELKNTDAFIKLGTPFVLKHLYNEGLDGEAGVNTLGGLVDQFQEPVDSDAEVEAEWVNKAEVLLRDVEESLN